MKITKEHLKQIIKEELNTVFEGDVIDATDRFSKPTDNTPPDVSGPSAQITDIAQKQLLKKVSSLAVLANELKNIPKDSEGNIKNRREKIEEIFGVAKEVEKQFKDSTDKKSLFDSFIENFPVALWPKEFSGYTIDKISSEENNTLDRPSLVTAIVIKNAGVADKNIDPLISKAFLTWNKKATKGIKPPKLLPGFDETY